jgi:hypothetical protein
MAKNQPTSIRIFKDPVLSENIEALVYDLAVRSGMFVPINARSYRYKKYMILQGPDDRWNVFLTSGRIHIHSYFLKVSALTACKLHEKHRSKSLGDLAYDDRDFQKNYVDSIHYRNTYRRSNDPVIKDTVQWRWEIAYGNARRAKTKIDQVFKTLTA